MVFSIFFCKAALERAEQQKAMAETKLAENVEKEATAGQQIEALDEQAMAREDAAKAAAEVLNKTAAVNEAKAAVAAAHEALQSNPSSPVLNATLNKAKASYPFPLACSVLLSVTIQSTTHFLLEHNILPGYHSVGSSDVSFRMACNPFEHFMGSEDLLCNIRRHSMSDLQKSIDIVLYCGSAWVKWDYRTISSSP